MASKIGKILVVDDNQGIRRALEILLPLHFAEVKTIPSPSTLVSTLEQYRPDVVLLDMNFYTNINTGNEGLYWAGEIKKMVPEVEVVLFTAYADIALAVEGMKRGAFDFIVKPWDNDKLIEVLTAARDKARKALKRDTHSSFDQKSDSPMFWGTSPAMKNIGKTLDKIAPTDATVLITGENGTGKDVLAREIHAHSLRSEKRNRWSPSMQGPSPRRCSKASCSAMSRAHSPMPTQTTWGSSSKPMAARSSWTR